MAERGSRYQGAVYGRPYGSDATDGYRAEDFGGQDFGGQDFASQDYRGQDFGGRDRGGQNHGFYDDGPDDWGDQDGGEARRRAAARRRAHAESQLRARADAEADAIAAAAAGYTSHTAGRGRNRRNLILASLFGGAATLVGERLVRVFGRKDMTSSAMNTAGNQGGTAGGMAGAQSTAPSGAPPAAAPKAAVLARTTDIPVGSAKIFASHKLVITQPTAGTFKAYSIVCTHAGCILDQVKGAKIYCPCHAGVFNLDGTVASGPPPNPLPTKHINVADGQITL
jgi:Rieske Fe-S protein